jgi:cofilin
MIYEDGRTQDKLIYLYWAPDTAPVKSKLISATANQSFQSKLVGIGLVLQGSDLSDLEK